MALKRNPSNTADSRAKGVVTEEMAMDAIRVGIVGAGSNTRLRHIPGLLAAPGVELVAVVNRTLESGRRVAEEYRIPRVCKSWQEVVAAPDIDAVVIGTWPYLHAEVSIAALNAGKHVLCEARMACDLAEARRMLEASRQHSSLVTQVVPSPFTLSVDACIRRLIKEGAVGQLLGIDIVDHRPGFPDLDAPAGWRELSEFSGLNIMSLGIWYEAVIRWLGVADSVQASGGLMVNQRRDPATGAMRDLDIPDWLCATASMRCGATALFSIRNVGGLVPRRECVLTGDEGSLRFDGVTLSLGRRNDERMEAVQVPDTERGQWRVEQEFVDAVRGVAPVRLTTFEDGVRYMAFTQAVADSLCSGQIESVQE